MEVFFSSIKTNLLVSTGIAMNRLTLLSHLTGLPGFRMKILLAESDLFVFIHLETWLEPTMYYIAWLVV